jgi:hypothetical protein
MTAANSLKGQGSQEGLEGVDRQTTIRTFFKPDLLQDDAFTEGRPSFLGGSELSFDSDTATSGQIPLVQNTNNRVIINNRQPSTIDDRWLTAEDLMQAAENPNLYTHSPIVLIPFENEQPSTDLNLDQIKNNPFTILNIDTKSPMANPSEGSNQVS